MMYIIFRHNKELGAYDDVVPYRPNIHMVSVLRQVLVEPEAAEAMVPVCVVSINISEVNTLI